MGYSGYPGLEDLLLPIPDEAPAKSPINSNATPTRRSPIPTCRMPPSVHHHSSHRILAPSIGSPRALLARIPSLFHRPHSHADEATELQQAQKQGIFSQLGPCSVKVAAVRDKKVFIPRKRSSRAANRMARGSSSQSQPAATSTSATQTTPNGSAQATTLGAPTIRSATAHVVGSSRTFDLLRTSPKRR
ncbi:hypothetical protein DFJ58DRAFT_734927 [Suillus subalutaceus]|uniref:uncharacterized protein n=1 Tax=Suillus subalutaceus TaxID=48586 RepID=UPI001B868BCC|nr:uncharacterized protein DFJ58DRAFT_734927 [Suillus subalutaceus]KAG1836504.1 hypothetical protein DFJ58DRAFT_734927 [Suillus subalutaceus]